MASRESVGSEVATVADTLEQLAVWDARLSTEPLGTCTPLVDARGVGSEHAIASTHSSLSIRLVARMTRCLPFGPSWRRMMFWATSFVEHWIKWTVPSSGIVKRPPAKRGRWMIKEKLTTGERFPAVEEMRTTYTLISSLRSIVKDEKTSENAWSSG